MTPFPAPSDATPVWTLRQLPPPGGRLRHDDEGELKCEGCGKWMHARDLKPRYVLELREVEEGEPRAKYLCPSCAQRQIVDKGLRTATPDTKWIGRAMFYGVTLWEGTSADGNPVDFLVIQWTKTPPAEGQEA